MQRSEHFPEHLLACADAPMVLAFAARVIVASLEGR